MKYPSASKSLAPALIVLLTACGGGGGGGSSTVSGQIVDSLVEGLQYTSGSISGLTDANGRFQAASGADITFRVGDIVLGTLSARDVLNIVDLVDGAELYSTANPRIYNTARFLQSIDDDRDTSNGIQITQQVRDLAVGVSMDFSDPSWDSASSTTDFFAALGAPIRRHGRSERARQRVAEGQPAGAVLGTVAGLGQHHQRTLGGASGTQESSS